MIELKYILKGLREQKQVSMDKMCEDLNSLYNVTLAKSTISKWENGKAEPSLAYARILTKYFNVTLDYLLGLENEEYYNFSSTSKKEIMLLENYNKLNDLGKEKLIEYSNDLIETPKYLSITFDEITSTKDNVIELNSKDNKETEEKFIPYKSLDEAGTTIAAHDDNLTDEEKERADKILLDYINNERLKEFNKKHNTR